MTDDLDVQRPEDLRDTATRRIGPGHTYGEEPMIVADTPVPRDLVCVPDGERSSTISESELDLLLGPPSPSPSPDRPPLRLITTLLLALALIATPSLARAAGPPALPRVAEKADLDEHLGRQIPRALAFHDQDGRRVSLGDSFDGKRPVVLVLAYYHCPMLCGLVLRGVVDGMNQLRFTLGEDYRALTVSIDPRDTPAGARAKQRSSLGALPRGGDTPAGWPFLVGEQASIAKLADAVGFRFAYDPRTDQFAHPAAAIVLTPEGRVSRYLYGVTFSARDLRLSLVEAGEGKTGTIVDRIIMTCYRYDPAARAYGPFVVGFVRIGGAFILAAVAGTVGLLFLREARRRREPRSP